MRKLKMLSKTVYISLFLSHFQKLNTLTPAHTVPINSEQTTYTGVPIASLINKSDSIVDIFHEMPFFLSDQNSETSSSMNTYPTKDLKF